VFAPAIIVLYFPLGKYERYFKANKALFMILVGLAVGMGVGFFSMFFFLGNIVLALLLIALLEIIKFLAMMQRPFRMKYDAPFYGFAFGAGISVMMVFTFIYGFQLFALDPVNLVLILLLSYNYTFVQASTGGIIGYGSKKGDFWRYLIRAFLISGLHVSMITFFWEGRFSLVVDFIILVIGAIYGTFLVFYVYSEIFPEVVSDKLQELEKEKDDTNST